MTIYNREDSRAVLPQLEKKIDELQSRIQELETQDYIVEQGTDGIWTYRKWNSGISECWGMYTVNSTSIASNGYFALSPSAYPNIFITEPVVSFSAGGEGNPHITPMYCRAAKVNGVYSTVDAYIRNLRSSTHTTSVWGYYVVKGTWK